MGRSAGGLGAGAHNDTGRRPSQQSRRGQGPGAGDARCCSLRAHVAGSRRGCPPWATLKEGAGGRMSWCALTPQTFCLHHFHRLPVHRPGAHATSRGKQTGCVSKVTGILRFETGLWGPSVSHRGPSRGPRGCREEETRISDVSAGVRLFSTGLRTDSSLPGERASF